MEEANLQQALLADVVVRRKRRHSLTYTTPDNAIVDTNGVTAANGCNKDENDLELQLSAPAIKHRQLDKAGEIPVVKEIKRSTDFGLEDFCDEVLFEIFKYLDSWTMLALINSSTRFVGLLLDHRFWHNIDLSKGPLPLGILEDILARSNEKTHTIKMCGPPSNQHVTGEFRQFTLTLKSVFPKLVNVLQVLELEGVSLDFNFIQIQHFPPSLKRLVLKDCSVKIPEEVKSIFHLMDTHLTLLEELAIEDNDWFEPYYIMAMSKLPVLRYLSLKGCRRMWKSVPYGSMAARFGFLKLEVLDLRFTPITNGDLQCFGAIESLKELLLECPERRPLQDWSFLSCDPAKSNQDENHEEPSITSDGQQVWRSPELVNSDDVPSSSTRQSMYPTVERLFNTSRPNSESLINSSGSQAGSSLYVSESDTDSEKSNAKKTITLQKITRTPTLDQVISLTDPEFNDLLNRMVPIPDENVRDAEDGKVDDVQTEQNNTEEHNDGKPSTSKAAALKESMKAPSTASQCVPPTNDDIPSTSKNVCTNAAAKPSDDAVAKNETRENNSNPNSPPMRFINDTDGSDYDCDGIGCGDRYSSTSPASSILDTSSEDDIDDDVDDDTDDDDDDDDGNNGNESRRACSRHGNKQHNSNGKMPASRKNNNHNDSSETSSSSGSSTSGTSDSSSTPSLGVGPSSRRPVVLVRLNASDAAEAAMNIPPPPPPPGPPPRAVVIYPPQGEEGGVAVYDRMNQLHENVRVLNQRRLTLSGNNPAFSRFLPRPDQIIYMNPNNPREPLFVMHERRNLQSRRDRARMAAQQAAAVQQQSGSQTAGSHRPRVGQFDQVMTHPMFWHIMNQGNSPTPPRHRLRRSVSPDCSQVTDRAIYSFGRATNPVEPGVVWIRNIHRSMNNRLERIVLRNYIQITNLTLHHLVQCSPYLVYIDVSGTSVTRSGVRSFQMRKPDCKVVADHLANETDSCTASDAESNANEEHEQQASAPQPAVDLPAAVQPAVDPPAAPLPTVDRPAPAPQPQEPPAPQPANRSGGNAQPNE